MQSSMKILKIAHIFPHNLFTILMLQQLLNFLFTKK